MTAGVQRAGGPGLQAIPGGWQLTETAPEPWLAAVDPETGKASFASAVYQRDPAALMARMWDGLGKTPREVAELDPNWRNPALRDEFNLDVAMALAERTGTVFSLRPVLAASNAEPEACALPRAELAAAEAEPELEAEP